MSQNKILINKKKKSVLLIHGFTASTQEMENLAKVLSKKYKVHVPLLPGHNTTETEFSKTNANMYYEHVLKEYESMRNPFAVLGLSFGSMLAIKLASEKKVSKLVLLAPAGKFKFYNKFMPVLRLFTNKISKIKTKTGYPWDLRKKESAKIRIAYDYVLLNQFIDVMRFSKKVLKLIKKIKSDTLIIHSILDRTTPISGAKKIFKNLNSKKRFITLHKSGHIITWDYDSKLVLKEIEKFLE